MEFAVINVTFWWLYEKMKPARYNHIGHFINSNELFWHWLLLSSPPSFAFCAVFRFCFFDICGSVLSLSVKMDIRRFHTARCEHSIVHDHIKNELTKHRLRRFCAVWCGLPACTPHIALTAWRLSLLTYFPIFVTPKRNPDRKKDP